MKNRSAAAMLRHGLAANILAGTRLALFLPVRALDFRYSAGNYLVLVLASLGCLLVAGMLREGFSGYLNIGALNVALAQIPLILLACLAAARLFRQPALFLAFAVLLVSTDPVFKAVALIIHFVTGVEATTRYAAAANLLFIGWAFAVNVRTQLLLTGWRGLRSAALLAMFAALLAFFVWFFPRTELWSARPEPADAADAAINRPSVAREDLFHLQGTLLDQRLSELKQERPGVEDLYLVAVAPFGLQDTFAKELLVVRKLMDERFDTSGRSIALINHPATLQDAPIASVSNLRAVLAHLGESINVEEDIVFLYVTTHGSPDHQLLFQLPPLQLQQLTPTALSRMLADSGIKWKVIVLSACFSGGYIEPLKDENTLIVTAADSKHTSFGCEYSSDFTWFSKAFFDEALRRTWSFADAFEQARESVSAREKAGGFESSNPQMFMGPAIRDKLAGLERRLAALKPGAN